MVIVDDEIEFVSSLKERLFMFWRYDQSLFKFLRGDILFQNNRLNADDGLCIDMAIVVLFSGAHIN